MDAFPGVRCASPGLFSFRPYGTKCLGAWTKGLGSLTKGRGAWTKGLGSSAKGLGGWTKGLGSLTKGRGAWTKSLGSLTKGRGALAKGLVSSAKSLGSSRSCQSKLVLSPKAFMRLPRGLRRLIRPAGASTRPAAPQPCVAVRMRRNVLHSSAGGTRTLRAPR